MIVCGNTQRRYALHTAHTTYQMAADAEGRLLHLYYGKRTDAPRTIAPPHNDPGCWPDLLPQEYPAPGLGDNHAPFFAPEWSDGSRAAALRFAGAEVCPAQDVLPGLPSFHTGGETLRITLQDLQGLTVTLRYTVFADCDLITRSAVVENTGSAPVTLRGVPSGVVDFARKDLDLITFDGAWAAERTPFRGPVRPGVQSIGSVGGIPPCAQPRRGAVRPRCHREPGRLLGSGAGVQRQFPHPDRAHHRRHPGFGGHRALWLCLDPGPGGGFFHPGTGAGIQRAGPGRHEPLLPRCRARPSAARALA